MQRQHKRIQYFTEITLECSSGKRQARISDLSVGGCFVDTIINVCKDEEVHLSCALEGDDQLDVKGKVAYVMNGFGFGVVFTELDGVSEAALKKVIEKH